VEGVHLRPTAAVLTGMTASAVVLGGLFLGADTVGDGRTSHPAYPVAASDDGHSLVTADGEPFLYLADTVWLAPSRLDQDGLRHLLDTRAAQGFTTIQVSVLPFVHLDRDLTNAYGDRPLRGTDLSAPVEVGARTADPTSPDYDYWDHLDVFLRLAAERGMQLTLVPSWYGYQGEDWRGHVDEASARTYGRFLGERLGSHRNLMWLLGGDNDAVGDIFRARGPHRAWDVRAATRAMAEGIRETEAVRHLASYHAARNVSSLAHFADDGWHSFVSAYSDELTWTKVTDNRGTGRPVVMTEAYYDAREYTVLDRQELRAQAWWTVLGGGGFAYGHEDVWDLDPGHGPDSTARPDATWRDALAAPSARDVTVLGDLVRDLMPLRPADEIFVVGRGGGTGRASAAVSDDGRTALVYVAEARPVVVQVKAFFPRGATATWVDPAGGSTGQPARVLTDRSSVRLWPPAGWDDAVLVLRSR
jgi:Protein of unknown function (DUF4038)/Putative collagen-binding domain of a collagenase